MNYLQYKKFQNDFLKCKTSECWRWKPTFRRHHDTILKAKWVRLRPHEDDCKAQTHKFENALQSG